jgi:hypothetical protein
MKNEEQVLSDEYSETEDSKDSLSCGALAVADSVGVYAVAQYSATRSPSLGRDMPQV